MSVQSVYLNKPGGGEGRNQRILVVSKYDLPDPPPDSVIFLWSFPLPPPVSSWAVHWQSTFSSPIFVFCWRCLISPLLSPSPEKHVIFPKSFFPPPPPLINYDWPLSWRQRDIITKNIGFLITLAQKKKIDSPMAELKVHNVSQVCHLGCTKTVEP